jgi:hypothetical protein
MSSLYLSLLQQRHLYLHLHISSLFHSLYLLRVLSIFFIRLLRRLYYPRAILLSPHAHPTPKQYRVTDNPHGFLKGRKTFASLTRGNKTTNMSSKGRDTGGWSGEKQLDTGHRNMSVWKLIMLLATETV